MLEACNNNPLASIDQATISRAGVVGASGTKSVQFGATGKKEVYLLVRSAEQADVIIVAVSLVFLKRANLVQTRMEFSLRISQFVLKFGRRSGT